MALSSKLNDQKTPDEIGEMLDSLGKLIDRTKVMYEQYFMGIQRMPPSQLHRDIERRIREITQMQIRNTGLRFRFATLTQKFGSYNTYWKRTIRKIERGEYIRDVARVGRNAARRGVDIPDELLAKVPIRMRKRILRDRELMAARAAKEEARAAKDEARAEAATPAAESTKTSKAPGNVHKVSLDDDLDLDSIFASMTAEDPSSSSSNPAVSEFAERPGSYQQSRPAAPPAPPAERARTVPPLPQRPPARGRPAPPPRQAAPRRAQTAQPRAAPPPGMSEREGRALFDQYAKARRLVGDKRPVTYDQLMNKLSRQAPKIMKDYNAKGVGFNVVIKGDKVVLKAKPKKDV